MHIRPDHGPQSDDDLAARAAQGDQSALEGLYDRYFDALYDFALRTARRPDIAAKTVERAFVTAWEDAQRGQAGHNVKPWLYAIARVSAIDNLRRGRGLSSAAFGQAGEGASPLFARTDDSASTGTEDGGAGPELAELVWNAAAALSPKQYSLLDMHLRRGLSAQDLAESLRLTGSNVYAMLSRLREAISEPVLYTLLITHGRRACRELDILLAEPRIAAHEGRTRRAVRDHLRTCVRCQAAKRGYASPLAVFAALAPVPAAPGVKESVWHATLSYVNAIPSPEGRPLRERRRAEPAKLPLLAAGGGGLLSLLALLLVGVLVFGSDGGSSASAQDPADVHSTDRETGEPSSDSTIEIAWTAVPGADAYSVMWTQGRDDLPDTEGDLPGSATGTESPALEPGRWYFHLRTLGQNGDWTSTVHLGPFEIIQDEDAPRRSATPTPLPETATPGPTPEFPAPTTAPETAAPTAPPTQPPAPTPTETPTETPSPPTDTPTPPTSTP